MTDRIRPHVTDGSPCWCNARTVIVCSACDEYTTPDPACWKCGGEGLVDASAMDDGPVIVIHDAGPSIFIHEGDR